MAQAHALITGAAGFIGSSLTDRLLAMDVEVTGVDMFTDYYDPALKRRNLENAMKHPGFTLLELDLGEDEPELLPAISGEDVFTAHVRGDEHGHLFQDRVAGQVPVRIVDLFEVIDVDHDQRQGSGVPITTPHLSLE